MKVYAKIRMSQNTGQAQILKEKPQSTLQLKINVSQCT